MDLEILNVTELIQFLIKSRLLQKYKGDITKISFIAKIGLFIYLP
jgi:hypothetical protein